ncbi:hypothetical protein KHA80_12385 [Anaerobacillus sp. HL2]|nr:hypothetical protein KHA80_12385 [Anaerobacillus sp. HL2]
MRKGVTVAQIAVDLSEKKIPLNRQFNNLGSRNDHTYPKK